VNIEQKKNNEEEVLDVFSVAQTISEHLFVLRLFNIAAFQTTTENCCLFAKLSYLVLNEPGDDQLSKYQLSLKASLICNITSVV